MATSAALAQVPWKQSASDEGVPGLTITLPVPESDVAKAVEEIVDDSIIHGSYIYERDKAPINGAYAVKDSDVLKGNEGASKLFYKVADKVVAPRFFRGSADVGRITVRYLVQGVGPATTRLQIDAVFTEDGRRKQHPSTGVVENAEYHAIDTEIKNMQAFEAQNTSIKTGVSTSSHEYSAQPPLRVATTPVTHPAASAAYIPQPSITGSGSKPLQAVADNDLDQLRIQANSLRSEVEMRVVGTAVPLKSSPFHASATLASLSGNPEVLVLIITPHWYGVETQGGQHGWIQRNHLERLP